MFSGVWALLLAHLFVSCSASWGGGGRHNVSCHPGLHLAIMRLEIACSAEASRRHGCQDCVLRHQTLSLTLASNTLNQWSSTTSLWTGAECRMFANY